MLRRVIVCSWAAVALAAPSSVVAKRVLVVTDPHSSTKPATLLEFAITEELRNNDATVVLRPTELSPKQARAQRFAAQAENLRQNGRRQFEQLELDLALKQLNKAVQKLDKAMPMLEDIRPLLDTLEMLCATYLLLGQERRARTSLERLLVLDVNASPDEVVFNPQMMAVFDAVASRVGGGPVFDVEVTVDPPGAAVFFDGRLIGVAPATAKDVHRGRHYVSAALKGFDPVGRAVELKPRSGHFLSLKLSESRRSSPSEAAATAAVAAIDDEVMPAEAQDLVDKFGADIILLISSGRGGARLVSYDANGSHRYDKSSSSRVTDLGSARKMAHTLLGPLARPRASDDGDTDFAATRSDDEAYSDDFGDGESG
ncbi:MAG: PEGA domain-containing protein, partial [Myxococcota bacterium]